LIHVKCIHELYSLLGNTRIATRLAMHVHPTIQSAYKAFYIVDQINAVSSTSLIAQLTVSPCAWRMTSPLGTPRGRCDEYSSWFSLS
jgi:hypothetical protein